MLSAGGSHAAVSSLYILMTFLAVLLAYGWMEESRLAPALILIGLPVTWIILSRFTPWPDHAD